MARVTPTSLPHFGSHRIEQEETRIGTTFHLGSDAKRLSRAKSVWKLGIYLAEVPWVNDGFDPGSAANGH